MKDAAPGPALASKISLLQRTNRASAIVGVVMLALVVGIAIWSLQQIASTEYWLTHTYQVLGASYQLSYDLKDTQASNRAYLLQPTDQYRSEFEAATEHVDRSFALLKSLTTDNSAQQARLNQLAPLLSRRTERLKKLMSTRDLSGLDEAERLREERHGKQDGDQLRSLTKEIQDEEYRLAAQREHLRRVRLIQGMAGTIGSAFLALVALFVSSLQVRRAVHDLIQTDQQRHQSESMVASLFEAAPEAILVVDSGNRILRTNPEIEHLFGYRREELANQPATILVPESLHATLERLSHEFFNSSASGHVNKHVETTLLRKNGEEFFAEISLGRIMTGSSTFAVLFASDISQRRADEAKLRANAEDLRFLSGKLLTAQEDERRRIARNLHDDLSQSLACLSMDLGRLAEKSAIEDVHHSLASLREQTREAVELVRTISHQLHPSILEDLGLKPALIEYCEEFEDRTGIATHIQCDRLPNELPPKITSCVYYVMVECLRNIAKHSHGSSARAVIDIRDEMLNLIVTDDGVGFSSNPGRSGIGLTAMRERLHLVGGELLIGPAPDHGAQVVANLPLS